MVKLKCNVCGKFCPEISKERRNEMLSNMICIDNLCDKCYHMALQFKHQFYDAGYIDKILSCEVQITDPKTGQVSNRDVQLPASWFFSIEKSPNDSNNSK